MSLNRRICESIEEIMERDYNVLAKEVLSWEDKIEYSGYCETCRYSEQVVEVTYLDLAGRTQTWTYHGTFSALINAL